MLKHNGIKSNIFTNQNKFFDKNEFLYLCIILLYIDPSTTFPNGAKYVS